jgi:dihydrolipoamide dehydrogenase
MSEEKRDLIVVGSGPGGYIAAIRGSQLGRKVTIIEKESLGGVCLNWGCIPSKALLKSAALYQKCHHASEFGLTIDSIKVDFPAIVKRSRDVSGKLSGGVTYLMKKNGIEVVYGNAKILPNQKLEVKDSKGSKIFSFNDIIIATGARARTLPNVKIDGEKIHTYRTLLEYTVQPKKTLVVGGGVIGCEFAYFHQALGTEVTIVEPLKQILPMEDGEVSSALNKSFAKQGMTIKTGTLAKDIVRKGDTVTAVLEKDGKTEKWEGDCVLISVGVQANTEDLGLEEIGVELDRGFIKTDEFMQTSLPNHYAIGDVAGPPMLAHVASHEALIAVEYMTGHSEQGMHYDNIPSCAYCVPQVASVGITEEKAKEQGLNYKVGKVPFAAIGKAIAIGEAEGFTKMIIDAATEEILGVHIIHPEATELITQVATLRQLEGVASSFLETVHPHPTLSEAMLETAAVSLGRPLNF